jgi:hypothetical protein
MGTDVRATTVIVFGRGDLVKVGMKDWEARELGDTGLRGCLSGADR